MDRRNAAVRRVSPASADSGSCRMDGEHLKAIRPLFQCVSSWRACPQAYRDKPGISAHGPTRMISPLLTVPLLGS